MTNHPNRGRYKSIRDYVSAWQFETDFIDAARKWFGVDDIELTGTGRVVLRPGADERDVDRVDVAAFVDAFRAEHDGRIPSGRVYLYVTREQAEAAIRRMGYSIGTTGGWQLPTGEWGSVTPTDDGRRWIVTPHAPFDPSEKRSYDGTLLD